jgi:RHS repeat-associated protein
VGRTATFTYDAIGRRLSSSNAFGTTVREYNPLNLVTRTTNPTSGITDLTYDPNGNLLTVKDARNNTTTYAYDNSDRLETRRDALLVVESFIYDGNGNVTESTDRRGKVTTYTYDALDRLSFIGFGKQPGPVYESSVTYTYDEASRLTDAVDSVTGTVSRDYDDLDRLTSETSPRGIVSYTYDDVGRRTSTTVTGQPGIVYTYDDADRLTQITQNGANVAFTYDVGGRRSSVTLPNGVVTKYTYNAASDLTEIVYQAGVTNLGNLSYTYDTAGRRSSTGGAFAQVNLPSAMESATYNVNNQLTLWGGTSQTYDGNGNLTNDGTKSYTWNARNQLVAVSGGISATFEYDAFGRRTSKSVGGSSTALLYDGAQVIQELSGSTPTSNLLVGALDELFTRTVGLDTTHYLADAHGPIALAGPSGVLQTTYRYEPYGQTTADGASNDNPFQYTGRENDGTGLYYYRARYYNPHLQRFISEDPAEFVAGDTNLYAYVGNDPINFTDPLGLEKESAVCRALPDGRTVGVVGMIGAHAGAVGTAEYVINYNSGRIDGFGSVGIWGPGWVGLMSGGVFSGPIWGLGQDNSAYSGGFTGATLGLPSGLSFSAESSSGAGSGRFWSFTSEGATALTVGWTPNFTGGAGFTPFATGASSPKEIGSLFDNAGILAAPTDYLMYMAKRLCQ